MADPAAEAETDDESYAAFQHAAADLETRVDLLIMQLTAETERGPIYYKELC